MSKTQNRTYSRYTEEAVRLLGSQIKYERLEQKQSMSLVAERVGVDRKLIMRIENGDPTCAIGVVFEVATVLGINLFDMDKLQLKRQIRSTGEKLALMPKYARRKKVVVDDAF